jgi:hypothetical protein
MVSLWRGGVVLPEVPGLPLSVAKRQKLIRHGSPGSGRFAAGAHTF